MFLDKVFCRRIVYSDPVLPCFLLDSASGNSNCSSRLLTRRRSEHLTLEIPELGALGDGGDGDDGGWVGGGVLQL